ncbi:MAG: 50S ribosomal protein L3 [Planctomycetaceae bacterium]|nr:50S ribosomal protein L3 [Planctomycetaceae bacterium]
MAVGLLGRKIGMTQVYDAGGQLVPVTVIEAGPCAVLQVRTADRDGYDAVQVGFDDRLGEKDLERPVEQRNRSRASRAERGHVVSLASKRQKARQAAGVELLPKAGCEPKRFVREFRAEGADHGCEVGQELTLALLADVSHVDVVGTSKGRGTAGVMKRHNFSGQRASHGVKRVHRHPGSIGMSADPSRVYKGTRMAGQYGNARVTVRNLRVVRVDVENNMLLVEGAVPGANGGYLQIRKTNKVD